MPHGRRVGIPADQAREGADPPPTPPYGGRGEVCDEKRRKAMVGGSAFLPTKQEIRLLIMSKSFGGKRDLKPI